MNMHIKGWSLDGETVKDPYPYKGCGLDDVYLLSGYDVEETAYGRGVRVRDLEKLHEAIGLYLATSKKVLSGKELRFLRNQMGMTQSDLARLLGCNAQQVARYEKDLNQIPGPADRLIRLLYKDHVSTNKIAIKRLLDCLDKMDDQADTPMMFEQENSHWKKAIGF